MCSVVLSCVSVAEIARFTFHVLRWLDVCFRGQGLFVLRFTFDVLRFTASVLWAIVDMRVQRFRFNALFRAGAGPTMRRFCSSSMTAAAQASGGFIAVSSTNSGASGSSYPAEMPV